MNTYFLMCNNTGQLEPLYDETLDLLVLDPTLGSRFQETLTLALILQKLKPNVASNTRCARLIDQVIEGYNLIRGVALQAECPLTRKELVRLGELARKEVANQFVDGEWEGVKKAIRKLLSFLEATENYESAAEVMDETRQVGTRYFLLELGKA
jgi:hypothetical protein